MELTLKIDSNDAGELELLVNLLGSLRDGKRKIATAGGGQASGRGGRAQGRQRLPPRPQRRRPSRKSPSSSSSPRPEPEVESAAEPAEDSKPAEPVTAEQMVKDFEAHGRVPVVAGTGSDGAKVQVGDSVYWGPELTDTAVVKGLFRGKAVLALPDGTGIMVPTKEIRVYIEKAADMLERWRSRKGPTAADAEEVDEEVDEGDEDAGEDEGEGEDEAAAAMKFAVDYISDEGDDEGDDEGGGEAPWELTVEGIRERVLAIADGGDAYPVFKHLQELVAGRSGRRQAQRARSPGGDRQDV